MTTIAEAFELPPACEYGPTGHCAAGRHDRCTHRAGGPLEAGNWAPECYITLPNGTVPLSEPMVIRPSHVWRCPCECHSAPTATGRLW